MLLNSFFASPLEQFEILPLLPLYFGGLDFSITNETVIVLIVFVLFEILFLSLMKETDSTLFIIPNRWQVLLEGIYKMTLTLTVDNVGEKKGQAFFPLIFSIFCFIVSLNVIGLVPYSFTLTSHLIVTFALSFFVFLGLNIICVREHGLAFFSLFLPSGTSVALALLLVPIEMISFIFRPISLSIRLFANMMAGHTLLKVIAGFAWTLMGCTGVLFVVHYIPLLILIPVFGLELGVAVIQAFVFSTLTCLYLNDAVNLH